MRILGITLPENKRIEIGLTVLYGVGRPLAHTILDQAKVEYGLKPKDISVDQENAIRKVIETLKIEGDLKREVAGDIKTYRGSRHQRGLPSRGQRTKTNARTRRGARKTMGTGRKIAEKK